MKKIVSLSFFLLSTSLLAQNPKLSFTLETGSNDTAVSEKITPLNLVNDPVNSFLLRPLPSTTALPEILSNPTYALPNLGSKLAPHLTNNAQRVTLQQPSLRSMNDPKVSQLSEVKAVNRLSVLWGQYMKVLSDDNPTYQTYMNWALELGSTKMNCLERYMSCTTWCEFQGQQPGTQFINCDPSENGKQFIPGDPSECARPLNELPTDPTQPWPGGSGC